MAVTAVATIEAEIVFDIFIASNATFHNCMWPVDYHL